MWLHYENIILGRWFIVHIPYYLVLHYIVTYPVSNKHTQVTYYARTCLCNKKFLRGANAIFSKIVQLASEEVVLQAAANKKQVYANIIVRSGTFRPIYY